MTKDTITDFKNLEYPIQVAQISPNKKQFFIKDEELVVHQSFLFRKLWLLRIIKEVGPAIGDCSTLDAYKGKSIYPYVINYIAKVELLHNNQQEVFIIVNSNNESSIRGIEKAGFKRHTTIKAKRFLVFHFGVQRNSN
jgi:hypothetical protein